MSLRIVASRARADPCAETRELTRPVFVVEGVRRRRLLRRAGYLLAASAVVYLAMLGFILVTVPASRLSATTPQAARHSGRPRIAPPALRLARPPTRLARPPVAVAEVVVRRKPVAPPPPARPTAAPATTKKKKARNPSDGRAETRQVPLP